MSYINTTKFWDDWIEDRDRIDQHIKWLSTYNQPKPNSNNSNNSTKEKYIKIPLLLPFQSSVNNNIHKIGLYRAIFVSGSHQANKRSYYGGVYEWKGKNDYESKYKHDIKKLKIPNDKFLSVIDSKGENALLFQNCKLHKLRLKSNDTDSTEQLLFTAKPVKFEEKDDAAAAACGAMFKDRFGFNNLLHGKNTKQFLVQESGDTEVAFEYPDMYKWRFMSVAANEIKDTFYIVGGMNRGNNYNGIWKYEVKGTNVKDIKRRWELLPAKLPEGFAVATAGVTLLGAGRWDREKYLAIYGGFIRGRYRSYGTHNILVMNVRTKKWVYRYEIPLENINVEIRNTVNLRCEVRDRYHAIVLDKPKRKLLCHGYVREYGKKLDLTYPVPEYLIEYIWCIIVIEVFI